MNVRLMGVVNVTPDSFSDGGLYLEPEAAIAHGAELADEGAGILDVGGESTRPARGRGRGGGGAAPGGRGGRRGGGDRADRACGRGPGRARPHGLDRHLEAGRGRG